MSTVIKISLTIFFLLGVFAMTTMIQPKASNSTLRVAFPANKTALSYEPTKIHLGHEYIFLENVFSPLIDVDPKDGKLLPSITESFEWNGDDLILNIRSNSKTISGKLITAEDVEYSLKRLLVLSGNTHGNFKDLVCPNQNLTSVEQDCTGIKRDGSKIILKAGKRKSFLVPMLAAIDFAIIPKASIDPKTLAIIDFKETSGPYYVSKDSDSGDIELKANPNHFRYTKLIPQTIKLVPVDPKSKSASVDLLLKDQVDHLTTIDQAKPEDIFALTKTNSDLNLHFTHKIRNLSLVFTGKGLKSFSSQDRHAIGVQVQKAFTEILKTKSSYENTSEFFPSMADGGLTIQDLKAINAGFDKSESNISHKKIRIGLIRSGEIDSWTEELKKFLPEADLYQETNVPDFQKYNSEAEKPDAFIASTDTGFMEDINLISYTLAAGFFGLSKDDRQKWLAHYMEIETKIDRVDQLKKIHYEALATATLIPIAVSPFVAVIKKPWKMELSELYANNQLWLIKQQ